MTPDLYSLTETEGPCPKCAAQDRTHIGVTFGGLCLTHKWNALADASNLGDAKANDTLGDLNDRVADVTR